MIATAVVNSIVVHGLFIMKIRSLNQRKNLILIIIGKDWKSPHCLEPIIDSDPNYVTNDELKV